MKNLKFVMLLMVPLFCFSQKKTVNKPTNTIAISGTLKNFGKDVVLENQSELGTFISEEERINLNAVNGKFSRKFSAKEPTYYRLGRNHLYLSPKDVVTIDADFSDPEKSIIKGSNAELNRYLSGNFYPNAGSYLSGGENVGKTIQETIEKIKNKQKQRENQLVSLQNPPKKFVELEQARMKADLINSYGRYLLSYFMAMNNINDADSQKKITEEATKLTESEIKNLSKGFLNTDFLKLEIYRRVLPTILQYNTETSPEKTKLEDYLLAENIANTLKFSKDKNEISKNYQDNIQKIANQDYKSGLKKLYDKVMSYGNGDLAKNFKAQDVLGKIHNLEQYKGKIIYIDFWATWCMPCLQEMPHYTEMAKKYANDERIVFLSISIDDNVQAWKNNLKKRESAGNQWIISREKLKGYNVNAVPRTIIIDKDFKIFNFNGPAPSEPETEQLITKLLKSE